MRYCLHAAMLLLTIMMFCAAGCGQGGGNTVAILPDSAVVAVAHADAEALSSAAADVHRAESLLFDIHAKEHFMRSRGLNATADLYIKTLQSLGAL